MITLEQLELLKQEREEALEEAERGNFRACVEFIEGLGKFFDEMEEIIQCN